MQRYQQSKHVLGSEGLLTIVCDKDQEYVDKKFADAWSYISSFEKKFSRFIVDSELTKFNQTSGKKNKISSEFIYLLMKTKSLGIQSEGLFNPFILPSLQKSGYIGSWPDTQNFNKQINYSSRQTVDINELKIGKDWASIPKNSAIEFGGIGKGYLLDSLADRFSKDLYGYWFSLGGDIIFGGKDLDKNNWEVAIAIANKESERAGYVTNKNNQRVAVATSGITKRKGTLNNKSWHHIIDPRTGMPTNTDIITATVTDKSAAAADVFAKCLVILGSSAATEFIKTNKLKGVLMQTRDNRSSSPIIISGDIKQ